MLWGRPFSDIEKSSLVRSRTISPFLVRTVASRFTTFTSVEKVVVSCPHATPRAATRDTNQRGRIALPLLWLQDRRPGWQHEQIPVQILVDLHRLGKDFEDLL